MSDTHGRETVVVIELDQPFCTREWGDAFGSPTGLCTAALSALFPRKCHQSRFTCAVPSVYNPGTLTLRFTRSQDGMSAAFDPIVAGSIKSVSTSAGAINLGGMDRSRAALGVREQVTILLDDHQHPDTQVDKYRLQRFTGAAEGGSPAEGYNPNTRGTFWSKWLARNPYYQHYPLRVYEGYAGQTLDEMRVRHYLIDSIDGPNDGEVKIVAQDMFLVLESQKAVAPTASRGRLSASMTTGLVSFVVTPADIVTEDYPAEAGSPSEFYVAVGDEIIRVSRSGATFQALERGCYGTVEAAHDDDEKVQWVLRYTTQLCKDITYDLIANYSTLGDGSGGSDYIDADAWTTAAETLDELYTAVIAEPTPVGKLIGELMEQAGFTVIPDLSARMIDFIALRAGTSILTADDDSFIVANSLALTHRTEWRASQIWVHYGKKNPLGTHDDPENYHSVAITENPDKEGSTQYGTPAIRQVFSRFIPQFGRSQAEAVGERLLAMFQDPPREAVFSAHASRSEEVYVAGLIDLEVAEVVDASGAVATVQHAITRLQHGTEEIKLTSQAVVFVDEAADGGERVIYIENNAFNLNLRTVHDSLYTPLTGGSPTQSVRFIVEENVTVGSTSTSTVALTTGTWAAGVALTLENRGRIQGRGGDGANEPSIGTDTGLPGNNGGDALEALVALTVDNTDGEIWGGGGGGGSGGRFNSGVLALSFTGAGGGGAGTDEGVGGFQSLGDFGASNGTDEAGGTGGAGHYGAATGSGDGGTGGAPGTDGNAGNTSGTGHAGGAGGTKGDYIVGNSLVTWTAVGDVRGGVTA